LRTHLTAFQDDISVSYSVPGRVIASGSALASVPPGRDASWISEMEDVLERREIAKATRILEAKLEAGEDPGLCHKYLGISAFACGQNESAIEYFLKAIKLGCGDLDLVFYLAHAYLLVGKLREAVDLLSNPPIHSLSEFGRGLLRDFKEQIRFAMGFVEVDVVPLILCQERNLKSHLLIMAGKKAEARRVLEEALQVDPQDFLALNNLGLWEWNSEDAGVAWNLFRGSLDINPTWPDALANAFDAALKSNRLDLFAPLAERALELDPCHNLATRLLAFIKESGPAAYEIDSCRDVGYGW
jgi:tetratricopeptide (TPR) repeat protein